MKINLLFSIIFIHFSIYPYVGISQTNHCLSVGKDEQIKIGVTSYECITFYDDSQELYSDYNWDPLDLADEVDKNLICDDIRVFKFDENEIVTVSHGENNDILMAFAIKYETDQQLAYVDRLFWRIEEQNISVSKTGSDLLLTFGKRRNLRQRISFDFESRVWIRGERTKDNKSWPPANIPIFGNDINEKDGVSFISVIDSTILKNPLFQGPKNSGYE